MAVIRRADLTNKEDCRACLSIYRPYIEDTTFTFEYDVPSEEAFYQRMKRITAIYPWLVWEEDGEILGYAYGSAYGERAAYQWSADLSIYIRQGYGGGGRGRLLYEHLMAVLVQMGIRTVYGIITSENIGSMGFHERLGFRLVGTVHKSGYKMGKWLDVATLEKSIGQYTMEPQLLISADHLEIPPVTLTEIEKTSAG